MKHPCHPVIRHFKRLAIAAATLAVAAICRDVFSGDACWPKIHKETNSVYYWKTVLDFNSDDYEFLRQHKIGRIYLRMFDVDVDITDKADHAHTVPVATMTMTDRTYAKLHEVLPDMEFVPVVYITCGAIKDAAAYGTGGLARNIVSRVRNMCYYNALSRIEALQLDCDWTKTTEQAFFDLCDSVRQQLKEEEPGLLLSSTIRLHQLRGHIPPVDYGVLMVYNTGNFNDPDADNSILSVKDVKPYLKYLEKYPLHLDVAYPTYSWQLLFRNRRFAGLLNGVNVADTAKFSSLSPDRHVAKTDVPYRETSIRKGDMIRTEQSDYTTIVRVKKLIERRLDGRPHSNVLYHFDSRNLSKYSGNEIENLFSTASGK
jgi:hypothetical protein